MNTDNRPSMAEFFDWHHHPFADTHPMAAVFLSPKDVRIQDQALSLLACGKSFALCGPSGTGKSTLIAHLIGFSTPTVISPSCSTMPALIAQGCYEPSPTDSGSIPTAAALRF